MPGTAAMVQAITVITANARTMRVAVMAHFLVLEPELPANGPPAAARGTALPSGGRRRT